MIFWLGAILFLKEGNEVAILGLHDEMGKRGLVNTGSKLEGHNKFWISIKLTRYLPVLSWRSAYTWWPCTSFVANVHIIS